MQLICKDLAIGYSINQILISDVSLNCSMGNVFLIEGENGVGKTTLLRTLAKLIKPIEGTLHNLPIDKIHYLNPESLSLLPYMTGFEIINFFEKIHTSKVCEELYSLNLLNELLPKKYNDMSSGMKQLLKLSFSLMDSKELILWDEPLKCLSDKNKNEVVKVIEKVSERKVFVIANHGHDFESLETASKFIIDRNALRIK